nr:hypothetical protein [Streptomyces sp. SCSIO ZS0520]
MRGPEHPPRPLDARALAALAANPGCRRRALLDGAGVDKTALAAAIGSPSAFGQSQFALVRGNAFEARVKADGGAALLRLVHAHTAPQAEAPDPARSRVPDLGASGPEGRVARTALALREAVAAKAWTLLDHPLLTLDVAGSPAYLEPDALVVHPGGRCTVVEIKSFPMIDGTADPAKAGAAARQAAVYVLALEGLVRRLPEEEPPEPERLAAEQPGARTGEEARTDERARADEQAQVDERAQADDETRADEQARVDERTRTDEQARTGGHVLLDDKVLLVCPKDFSNLPAGAPVDIRRQLSVTRRQLARLTRVEEIAEELPEGTSFDVGRPPEELTASLESVPAAYAPECLAACELAFHCRARSRAEGQVTVLGRGVRAELGALTTVEEVLATACGAQCPGPDRQGLDPAPAEPTAAAEPTSPIAATDPTAADPTARALRRAAALRAEALAGAGLRQGGEERA